MKTVLLEPGRGYDDRATLTITGEVWAALLEVARQYGYGLNADRIIPTTDARLFAGALQLALDRGEIGERARQEAKGVIQLARAGGFIITIRERP